MNLVDAVTLRLSLHTKAANDERQAPCACRKCTSKNACSLSKKVGGVDCGRIRVTQEILLCNATPLLQFWGQLGSLACLVCTSRCGLELAVSDPVGSECFTPDLTANMFSHADR